MRLAHNILTSLYEIRCAYLAQKLDKKYQESFTPLFDLGYSQGYEDGLKRAIEETKRIMEEEI